MSNAAALTARALAETPLAAGRSSLRRHGSTFHAAHLALGRRSGARVELLYGFCRHVDDLVDEQSPAAARAALDALRADLASNRSHDPAVAGLIDLRARGLVDDAVLGEFLAGVAQDLVQVHYADTDELLRYCYRVAGTVGLMMVSLLEVKDPAARPFAIDLGVGMQLTNICRDVLEDARRGRVYLPATETRGPLAADELATGAAAAVARARRGVERLLARANAHYRSADAGMRYLPPRARLAVLAASRGYEAIGPRVLASDPVRLPERAFVGRWRRAGLFAGAAAASLVSGATPARAHDAALHAALRGKPGASAPARGKGERAEAGRPR